MAASVCTACCPAPPSIGPLVCSHGARTREDGTPIACWKRWGCGFLNCLISPVCWTWEAVDAFALGCIWVYTDRCCVQALRCVFCQPCGCDCYYYKDSVFKPDQRSLGTLNGRFTPANTVWKRPHEIFGAAESDHVVLFENPPSPSDIAQGQLGDCWMMTAMSAMAEYPNALQNLFVTKEFTERGKYTIRLYDSFEKKWKFVTVDDIFPCEAATKPPYKPVFAQPPGRELWPLIYEKAFAKHFGGYDLLDGGNILVALQAFTGDPVFHLSRQDSGGWKVFTLRTERDHAKKDELGRPKIKIGLTANKESNVFSDDKTFDVLMHFVKRKGVIGAGTTGEDQGKSNSTSGLVRGHAYSVLDARKFQDSKEGSNKETLRLVKLRNPWGKFEWEGAWSDGSKEWQEYKTAAKKLGHTKIDDEDDGVFWIPWEKFLEEFSMIDLCDRSTGFRDIALGQIDASSGTFGPCIGCVKGCGLYWGTCQGFRATCFGNKGAHDRLSRMRSSSQRKITARQVKPS
eukprot:m.259936 g.259936  ORF g.259936 m.259936 type:complete len:514 (+) comp26643_c0_seq19:30-1571(+)